MSHPQGQKIVQVLRGTDQAAPVSPDGFCQLQDGFSCLSVAAGADQLPALVDKDRLLGRAVLLGFVPDEIEGDEHAYCQQVAGQFGDA